MSEWEKVGESTGYLVPAAVTDELVAAYGRDNPFRALVGTPAPLTRRQRIIGRLRGYRWRVHVAVAVLRGTHECGGDW